MFWVGVSDTVQRDERAPPIIAMFGVLVAAVGTFSGVAFGTRNLTTIVEHLTERQSSIVKWKAEKTQMLIKLFTAKSDIHALR